MKACKHIAFFYREDRLNYLNQMIQAANTYPFYTDIFIHTNTIFDTDTLTKPTNGEIFLIGHDLTKKDPMRLPWYIRPLMKSQKDAYDIFIYTEDDILVPKEAIEYWLTNKDICIRNGCTLGFLRMEVDWEGKEFISDLHNEHSVSQQMTKITNLNSTLYAINDVNPYVAFWIYDKQEFHRFLESPHWNPNALLPMYGVREAAAIGMASTRTPDRLYAHTLLPLDTLKVLPACRVYHLANNYVNTPYCFFATLLLEEAVCVDEASFRHPNFVIQRKHESLMRKPPHNLL
jgi:hypothetical protein